MVGEAMLEPPADVTACLEAREREARRILRACGRMERLIQDLLDFSQLESGRLRLRPRPTDVDDLLEQALDSARALARDRRVELEVAPEARGLRPVCDRERILQALGNLLANALRFSPPETSVRVRTRPVGGELRISVEDRGPGIPEEDLQRLFEPYRQAGRRDVPHGARSVGLGLYIAKNVMDAHGGWISVESELGEGSVFTLGLPLPPARG
jgi:signal transduction histidine kinase